MTNIDCYTIDTFRRDARFLLSPGFTDPRLDALAEHFWGRKIKGGYIFTPHKAMLFDKIYRHGFKVKDGKLAHPKIPGKRFTAGDALHAILLAERIGA